MSADVAFPSNCENVREFNAALLDWLSGTPLGVTLGQSHDQIVTAVPIGGERCTLPGETTHAGVAEYLRRSLAGPAPFFVVPSSKGVNHRVTVGDGSNRIHGFYLYTSRPQELPYWPLDDEPPMRAFAAADGSVFEWEHVVFKIMDAVALLHARGHQRLRVRLTQGDLGFHVMVTLAEGSGIEFSHNEWGSTLLAYTSATGPRVGNLDVYPETPADALAREILAQGIVNGISDRGIGIDWAYAGWFAELIAETRRLGLVPREGFYAHWADHPGTGPRSWELGYTTGLAFPPPPRPRTRWRAGFTDAFPEPKVGRVTPDVDVTKQTGLQALAAAFTSPRGHFLGLFALAPKAVYRRERGSWARCETDDDLPLDAELVEVSYRFIKTFDVLEVWAHQSSLPSVSGEPRDWWSLAQHSCVFSGERAVDGRSSV